MFETVVPETVAPRSRRIFYESLPLSLALHALVGGAVLLANVWNVAFPQNSPKMYAAYQLAATPPPPPPPPPPPVVRRQIVPNVRAVPVKMPDVAPPFIPDEIPEITNDPVTEIPVEAVAQEAAQEGGVEGGVEGGEVGGQIGGVIGGLPTAPAPEVIEVKRDDPLPVGAISQEYPSYPEFALKRNWEDVLVVRYLIGKDGRVKDVTILQPPEREEFAREAVSKIRHWRFHPYRDANGEPKEVSHELTVQFRIARKGR
jgi:protein TonB